MLRFCLGAYGRPNHAWMPSLGAGLIRSSQHAVYCQTLLASQLDFETYFTRSSYTGGGRALAACLHLRRTGRSAYVDHDDSAAAH